MSETSTLTREKEQQFLILFLLITIKSRFYFNLKLNRHLNTKKLHFRYRYLISIFYILLIFNREFVPKILFIERQICFNFTRQLLYYRYKVKMRPSGRKIVTVGIFRMDTFYSILEMCQYSWITLCSVQSTLLLTIVLSSSVDSKRKDQQLQLN